MKRVFGLVACLLVLAVAAMGQQIVTEGMVARNVEQPRSVAVAAGGAMVTQYYVLSWQPINTPTGVCSLSVDKLSTAGVTVGGIVAGQDCSAAGTTTSALVTATAIKVKFAILGGGSVYYSLSAWIATPNVGMTWPNTPGIPVCTGTPCAAWGTTLTAPDGNVAHFFSGAGTWISPGGDSMTWPATPGVPNCTGTPCTAWGTTYNETNYIPNTYLGTFAAGANGFGTGAFTAAYSLPSATASTLGGVKPDGTSILNTAGAISVTPASVGAVATNTTVNGHALSSNVVVSATDITTGTMPTAQLGSGTASSSTCLFGDQTYKTCTATGTVSGQTAGFIPVASAATILSAPSPFDVGVTTAGVVTSADPVAAPYFTTTCVTCPNQETALLNSVARTLPSSGSSAWGFDTTANGGLFWLAENGGTPYYLTIALGLKAPAASPTFTGTVTVPSAAAYAPTTVATFGYDSTNNRFVGGNGTNTSFFSWFTTAPTTNALRKASGTLGLTVDSSVIDNGNTVTTSEPLVLTQTTNQFVLGTAPNQTTLNFPAPSGAVTHTFPTTTQLIAGVNSDTTTAHVAHATAVAGVLALSAITTGDLPSAATTRSATLTDLAPVVGDSGLLMVLDPSVPIHITRVFCAIQGSTNVVVNLDKRTEAAIGTDTGNHLLGADLTAVSGGANTSTFANGAAQCGGTTSCAVAAHAPIVMTFTSVSGTPTALDCGLDYTVD